MKVRCLVLLAMALLLAACGGGSGGSDPMPPDPGAESLVWDQGAWDQHNWH
jgi:ABC-type glycerol-3-phosphate transport system substrate-binding protein